MNDEELEDLNADQICHAVAHAEELFTRVRKHTRSDLCAWFVAHELNCHSEK